MPFSMLLRIVPQALALTLLLASGASATETSFKSTAPLRNSSEAGKAAAAQDALGRLLVRVTGRRAAAELTERFPPALSIVRQYRVIDGARLEAEFDDTVVRQVLEQAGETIWEAERPRLALWLVINDGERWLFRPAQPVSAAATTVDLRMVLSDVLGRAFAEVSALRGIEIDFTPGTDEVSADECAEELWTGFAQCLPDLDEELLILGRVAAPSALDAIEWNLREKGLWRRVWESDAAEAVHLVTDLLAERFMATQGPIRSYLLVVAAVGDLPTYADLQSRLNALQTVREWRVDSAARDSLTLRITSRTNEATLRDELDSLGLPFELARTGS